MIASRDEQDDEQEERVEYKLGVRKVQVISQRKMRRTGMLVMVVCVAVVTVSVGGKAGLEEKEDNVDGVLKKSKVELSRDKDFAKIWQEKRVLQMNVDSRHVRQITNRKGVDEFDKKIKDFQINVQRSFQKGKEFRLMPAKKENFNKIWLKKDGLKRSKKNIERFKGTSQKRGDFKKIRHKKEDIHGTRIKREADKGRLNENVKSVTITKEVKVPYPVLVTKLVAQPVRVEVERPLPVRVARPMPVRVDTIVHYPVKKYVPAPYPVIKEVPVFVRHHVVRPVPVRVAKPYPVIVERRVPIPVVRPVLHPVRIPVQVPVPVLRPLVNYVLYPVHKRVLYPVKVPVSKPVPYPVDRPYPVVVEKRTPYPVVKHVPCPMPVHVTVPAKSKGYTTTRHGLGSKESYDYARRWV